MGHRFLTSVGRSAASKVPLAMSYEFSYAPTNRAKCKAMSKSSVESSGQVDKVGEFTSYLTSWGNVHHEFHQVLLRFLIVWDKS